jgi:beta-lactamase superfamily II metal-dependent hydrolase
MRSVIATLTLLVIVSAGLTVQQLEIHFLNVGQGDAAIVQEGGRTAVIDAGPTTGIGAYLQSLHIDTIDLVVASHPHADHIGGMTALLQSTPVRFYLDNGVPYTTSIYRQTLAAVRASGAQYLNAPAPDSTINNGSVGILIEYGQFRALFTGDSELEELAYWLKSGRVPCVNVVKVAHHGSMNGTSPQWIAATRPQVAVIWVGAGNTYGHPSPLVINEWQSAGARVFRTDRDGTVVVVANEDGTFVVTTDNAQGNVVRITPYAEEPVAKPVTSSPSPDGRGGQGVRTCCRVCTTGKACGNSCISRDRQCHQAAGCACNAKP